MMRYQKSDTPIDRIRRQFGVDHVPEGSARREAGRICIAAELIRAQEQAQLWADSFGLDMAGILALQSDVARQAAGALALELLPMSPSQGGGDVSAEQEGDAFLSFVAQKWTGDMDGMIKRRLIRVLTIYSKTNFFVDRGTQRGLTCDAFRIFEDDLNKELKNRNIRVQVVCVPVAKDDLIPALLDGRGDIVAAGELITEWRKEQVDFTIPTKSHVYIQKATNYLGALFR